MDDYKGRKSNWWFTLQTFAHLLWFRRPNVCLMCTYVLSCHIKVLNYHIFISCSSAWLFLSYFSKGWFQKIAKLWILLVPAVLCITQSYTVSCAFHLLCLQFIQFLTVTVRVVHEIAQTICSIFFLSIDLFNPNFYLTIIFCAIKQVFCTFWCQQFSVRFCSSKF